MKEVQHCLSFGIDITNANKNVKPIIPSRNTTLYSGTSCCYGRYMYMRYNLYNAWQEIFSLNISPDAGSNGTTPPCRQTNFLSSSLQATRLLVRSCSSIFLHCWQVRKCPNGVNSTIDQVEFDVSRSFRSLSFVI